MKKIIASLGLLIVAMSAVALALGANWNVAGTWALNFDFGGSNYPHTMVVTSFDKYTGAFSGTGTYNVDPLYTWTVDGVVDGSNINFHILYTGTNAGYKVDAVGTIASDGLSMSGTWTGPEQSGTWTGAGTATWVCGEISDGKLKYSPGHFLAGQLLMTGYDVFGYNYQAHIFRGYFANVYLGRDGFGPYQGDDAAYLALYPKAADTWYWSYRTDWVMMKWNDAWLSNKDCDYDGNLDRHYGFEEYKGSGAWLTNHQWGVKTLDMKAPWNYFVKIVAPPSDATLGVDGKWYAADASLIGYEIWGEFAVTQEVSNDKSTGSHGLLYKSDHPGLGEWQA